MVYDQQAGLNPETPAQAFRDSVEYVAIPENAYDSQTWEGKKTKANFFKEEQAELEPFPPGRLTTSSPGNLHYQKQR